MGRNRRKHRGREQRAGDLSIENPNVPLSLWSDEAFEAFGASRSASGVRVNRKKMLGYPPFWRGVNLIAGDVGKLPLYVMKQHGRNKEIDQTHDLYSILRWKPNPLMTAFSFKQTLQAHALIEGNGYAYIDRDGAGKIQQLLPLDPGHVTPVKYDGRLWFLYTPPRETKARKLPSEEVLHIKGLGFDGVQGYPVLQLARDAMGGVLAAQDHAARYFKNGARPGGVLQHPGKLGDQARRNMRESWDRIHQGLENAHKIAILEEGTTYHGMGSNARDAQLVEARELDVKQVANLLGVPSHKLGDSDKVAYNSLGEENKSYVLDTLSRWLTNWEEEGRDKLLTDQEKSKSTHLIAFDYQELIKADITNLTDHVTKCFASGLLNQDEGRGYFGLNPVGDGKGQTFFIPSSLKPADQVGTPPSTTIPAPPTEATRQGLPPGLRAVIVDVSRRMIKRLSTHANKPSRNEGWYADHLGVIAEAFAAVTAACRDFGFKPPSPQSIAAEFCVSYETHFPRNFFEVNSNQSQMFEDKIVDFIAR